MCKVCSVFYGDSPCPSHRSRGAWSHKGVIFKENPGKKLHRHENSQDYKDAVSAKTKITIEESLNKQTEDRSQANELYVGN